MKLIEKLIKKEEARQRNTLMMIPSENYASKAVREAVGSVLMNKYSEGYPGKRYYQGNEIVDEIENLAIGRAKKLFKIPYANVQPYSGSPANSEVLFALCKPGETIMGMQLSAGGHLTHGHPDVTFSGTFFRSIQFGLDEKQKFNFTRIRQMAKKEKPSMMFVGTTAYPMKLDWKAFSEIADEVGAYFVADISHVAGLVVSGIYPTPVNYAHVITTTTHKALRGPRGAMIMVTKKGLKKDKDLTKKIDRAVFPGMQGGPHNNITTGIAICLQEAASSKFKSYARQVVKNARALASALCEGGLTLVGGGTECHLMLIDLRHQRLSGNVVAEGLEVAGIVTNRNSVPNDTQPPFYPSGIRLGTPAVTTRGMGNQEMKRIAIWIADVIKHVNPYKLPRAKEVRPNFIKDLKKKIVKDKILLNIAEEVKELCKKFPVA